MSGPYRTLRRPVGGWSARIWRREAVNGLLFGLVVTGSWASLNTMLAMIELFDKS